MRKRRIRPYMDSKIFKMKSRRRIQRAFLSWLVKNHHLLTIDLIIESRTDEILRFSFEGINSSICGALNTYEINVWVEWNNYCWDTIFSFESAPIRGANGFFCKFCRDHFLHDFPDCQFDEIYRAREEIWEKDIFHPFLEWINVELAPAKYLGLFGKPNYVTTAKLLDTPPRDSSSEDLAALLSTRST
jgi:hypothetical protein